MEAKTIEKDLEWLRQRSKKVKLNDIFMHNYLIQKTLCLI